MALHLERKIGQSIVITIAGQTVRVEVMRIKGIRVQLGITYPEGARVDRSEVHDRREAERLGGEPQEPRR